MLADNLEKNIDTIKKLMGENLTFKIRRFETKPPSKIKCALLFCDGLVNSILLGEHVIKKVQSASLPTQNRAIETLINEYIEAPEAKTETKLKEIIFSLNSGDAILLVGNDSRAVIISAKGYVKRSIEEPSGETVSLGSHEGFVEPILHNLAMLRRRLKTDKLKFESFTIGEKAPLSASLCYIEGVAGEEIIKRMRKRLEGVENRDIQNINALAEIIKDSPFSVFQTMSQTERPDIVASRLLEGRVAVFLDGSSAVLTAPAVLSEFFQAADDYYVNFYYSSVSRLLRIICFFLTISIPALYVGILTYHRELMPTNLLISIASARSGVPFPLFFETTLLLVAFDLLKDASAHVSSGLGQSLSIVGALILGESAVSAHFVSAPLVIITAATGITGLLNNSIRSASVIWRYILLFLSAIAGFYGYLFGFILLLLSLCKLKSLGKPYTMYFPPLSISQLRDTLVRFSWKQLNMRNIFKGRTK